MAGPVESSGEIETFAQTDSMPPSRRSITFDSIAVGDRVSLVFSPRDEPKPPFALTIRSPSGALIMDRVVRELPMGTPQSGAAIDFVASAPGVYKLEIREIKGNQKGLATLIVG